MALTELCAEIKNYFCLNESDKHIGDFAISNGVIAPSLNIAQNQYYRIVGSMFNDGVHQYGNPDDVLADEPAFHGAIWLMRVPKAVVELSDEIDGWIANYGASAQSPYQSESFGGYSYSKATGKNGNISWQDAFATRLSMYRRIRV